MFNLFISSFNEEKNCKYISYFLVSNPKNNTLTIYKNTKSR